MADLAVIRLKNTLDLFDEFVRSTVNSSAAGDVRGLEKMFAEKLRISPSYWSQLKSRERHIGEKLARQFEALCDKPPGWLDAQQRTQTARTSAAATPAPGAFNMTPTETPNTAPDPSLPANADERFAVGLFLTAYRMNPLAVKQRLLSMLEGELAKAQATDVAQARDAARPPLIKKRLTKIK